MAKLWAEVDEAVDFYWRKSHMRLHLAVERTEIHRPLEREEFWEVTPDSYWLGPKAPRRDLQERGYDLDRYDIVAVFYAYRQRPGHWSRYGGGTYGVDGRLQPRPA